MGALKGATIAQTIINTANMLIRFFIISRLVIARHLSGVVAISLFLCHSLFIFPPKYFLVIPAQAGIQLLFSPSFLKRGEGRFLSCQLF
jgi:hypothetical protein